MVKNEVKNAVSLKVCEECRKKVGVLYGEGICGDCLIVRGVKIVEEKAKPLDERLRQKTTMDNLMKAMVGYQNNQIKRGVIRSASERNK